MTFENRKIRECRLSLEALSFAGLSLFSAFMLWVAFDLDVWRGGTIGPGFFPVAILSILLIASILLFVKSAFRDKWLIVSPFQEGLEEDSALRSLLPGLSEKLGVSMQAMSKPGQGRFSAIFAGRKGALDGRVLTLISSEASGLTAGGAADYCKKHYEPVAGLFVDPDVIFVSAGSPFKTFNDVLKSGGSDESNIRLLLHRESESEHPIQYWLCHQIKLHLTARNYNEADALFTDMNGDSGEVGVANLSVVRNKINEGKLRALAIASVEPSKYLDQVPRLIDYSYQIITGRWLVAAVPVGTPVFLQKEWSSAISSVLKNTRIRGGKGEIEAWEYVDPDTIDNLLLSQTRSQNYIYQDNPKEENGDKFSGYLFALLSLIIFPVTLNFFGFIVAAFILAFPLMVLLSSKRSLPYVVTSLAISLGLVLGIEWLFSNVFHIVFPPSVIFKGV